MKTTSLILIALTSIACANQPVLSQNNYGTTRVIINQGGSSNPPPTYIGGGTLSQSAQNTPAGVGGDQFRGVLPNVPMGTVIGTAGDHVGRSRSATTSVESQPRNGLAPTRMGTAIGMPSDNVGRQNVGNSTVPMRNGLQPTRLGAAFAMPGDGLRSDIPGTPMYREQVNKRLRNASGQQNTQMSAPIQKYSQPLPATYGDSYDGKPKRNF